MSNLRIIWVGFNEEALTIMNSNLYKTYE